MAIGIIANMSSDSNTPTTTTAPSSSAPTALASETQVLKTKKDEYNKLVAQFKEAGVNSEQARPLQSHGRLEPPDTAQRAPNAATPKSRSTE